MEKKFECVCRHCGNTFLAVRRGLECCDECRPEVEREYQRRYYVNHRDKIIAKVKEGYRKSRVERPEYIICIDCGRPTEYRPNRKRCDECNKKKSAQQRVEARKKQAAQANEAKTAKVQERPACKKAEEKKPRARKKQAPLSLAECRKRDLEHGVSYGVGEMMGLHRR